MGKSVQAKENKAIDVKRKRENNGFQQPAYSTVVDIETPNSGLTVWLSDIHYPYQDKRAMDVALAYIQAKKPHTVVLGGDIFDFYSVSDFDRDPDRLEDSLQAEFDSAQEDLKEICKNATNVQFIDGNHCYRLCRQISKNPGLYGLRSLEFRKMAGLPDKVKHYPYLTKLKQGKLYYHHGQIANQNTAKATYSKFGKSMIVGHAHRADTHFATDGLTGEGHSVLVSGTLCDFKEARYVDHPNWQLGFCTAEFYEHNGESLFHSQHRLITNYSLVADGKVFKG